VLVTSDGRATLLWDGRSTPIGLPPLGRPRDEGTGTMEPGATLVLYTDGLYERRDEPLDAGLDRLAQTAGDHAAGTAAELVAAVMRTMLAQRRLPDDVCLLALRRT
jgi:serine phosphatase RsbU (regulator of sigma subunit)